MTRIAAQIGHVNGKSGAAWEEGTLNAIFPHVVNRLKAAGLKVDTFDGSLQYEPPNMQYRYAGAVFLHCDSYSATSSGYSIGYWEELHPGSQALGAVLKDIYGQVSGLRFGGYNITRGLHHYYGNRRFSRETKCAIIELGFVSNPTERKFLVDNAQRLGCAVADAYIAFFGKGNIDMERWSNRQSWGRVTLAETHVYVGKLEGQGTTEDAWLAITPFDGDTDITVQAITDNAIKTSTYKVSMNKILVVSAASFGLTGTVCMRVSANKPVTVTIDRRGWM